MNDNYWLERVVTKVNASFLNGTVMSDWVPDQQDPNAESRALDTLEIAGIIKSPGGFVGSEETYRIHELRSGRVRSAPTRQVVDFDYDKFLRFCEIYGFNPTRNGVSARLEIVNDVQPIIYIGNDKYALEALSSSSTTQPIVAYAAKHPDKDITIDELRANMTRTQLHNDSVNIRQLFKKNVFGKENLLRSFAEIGTKSFLIKKTALLTPNEVAAIKKASTN